MTKAEQLKAIQDMPLTAAHWMGRRDAYIHELEDVMKNYTVRDLDKCKYKLRDLNWRIDQCNDNFCAEMGWS